MFTNIILALILGVVLLAPGFGAALSVAYTDIDFRASKTDRLIVAMITFVTINGALYIPIFMFGTIAINTANEFTFFATIIGGITMSTIVIFYALNGVIRFVDYINNK